MQENLSRRERQILEIIYRLGEATANDVCEQLADDLANATVRTTLRVLESKNAVTHSRVGKQFVYRPKVAQKSAAKLALRKVLEVFFGGSVENALAAHLSDPKTKLTADQIERLRTLIDQQDQQEK